MTIKAKALKENKKTKVKEIQDKIGASKIMILTNYRGMSVKQVTELRKKLRAHKAEYKVYKNTFVVKALPGNLTGLTDKLAGPTAIVFCSDDVVMPAKALMQFIGENEKPGVVIGVLDNDLIQEKQIKELAKLPSRQELLGKVVGGLKSPLYGLVSVMHGPIRKFVYAVNAVKDLPSLKLRQASKRSQGGEK